MHSMRTLEKTTPWSGGGPGLLPSRYFSLIGDKALRQFFDAGILSSTAGDSNSWEDVW